MAVPGGSGSQRAGWWGRPPELAASARSPLILCGSGRREESKTRLWGLLQAVPALRMAMLEEGLALKHTQPALPCRGMPGAARLALSDPAREARPHTCPLLPRHVVPTGAKPHTSWHAGSVGCCCALWICTFHLRSARETHGGGEQEGLSGSAVTESRASSLQLPTRLQPRGQPARSTLSSGYCALPVLFFLSLFGLMPRRPGRRAARFPEADRAACLPLRAGRAPRFEAAFPPSPPCLCLRGGKGLVVQPRAENGSPRDSSLPTFLSSVSFGLVVSDVMGTSLRQRGCVIFLLLPEGLFLFTEKKGESYPGSLPATVPDCSFPPPSSKPLALGGETPECLKQITPKSACCKPATCSFGAWLESGVGARSLCSCPPQGLVLRAGAALCVWGRQRGRRCCCLLLLWMGNESFSWRAQRWCAGRALGRIGTALSRALLGAEWG